MPTNLFLLCNLCGSNRQLLFCLVEDLIFLRNRRDELHLCRYLQQKLRVFWGES